MEASITLPEEWFTDSRLTTNGSVSVDIIFLNTSESFRIGTVTLIRQPDITFTEDVVAILPVGTVFHNDLLMVPVHAHVVYSVATFSMLCNVTDGLIFERDGIVIDPKWNYELRQHLPTDISIVAMLSNPGSVTDQPAAPEVLFTLSVRVMPAAQTGQRQNFSCSVLYVSHVLNEKVQLRNMVTPQPATIIDYFDNNPFVGEIQIERSQLLAIFPYTQQSELINTAYFTGIEVSVPVQVLGVHQSGAITPYTPDDCTSLTDSVSINTMCTRVILTGNETRGDELAVVSLHYRGLVTNMTFRIWFPESPVSLVSTPANLSAVEGWLDQDLSLNRCVQQYQRGKLLAFANFTYSGQSPCYEVNIFSLIQPQLASSNDSVVRIDNDGMLVGLQPGECEITAGTNILPLTVHVLASSVQVENFNVLLTTGISLILSSHPDETLTASAFLLEDFNIDGAKISAIPGVVFSDGTEYLPTKDVIVTSLNQTVLSVEESIDITVVGSGVAVLQVTWAPECNSSNLASTNVTLAIDLPNPSHIEISLNSTRISPFGSLASRAGIAVSASLQAHLVYPDGTRVDISTDSRLQLDLSQANSLITTSISNDTVIIRANGDVRFIGIATVIVRVTGHTVTTQFNISVVDYSSLFMYATPYPVYNGSNAIRINQLHQIANTGIYQQALLHMVMILTDNSTTAELVFPFYESEDDFISVGGNRVTAISQGRATIRGNFVNQFTTIEMVVTNTAVVIIRFIEFTLGTDTLSGIRNIHTAQLRVSAMFNDSTIYNELLSGNRALYPGLVAFTSSVPTAASVNQFTGVLTLRSNHHDFVEVTVQTVLSTASATFSFACNLLAKVGDIDIGYQNGIPVPPQTVGTSFVLPIYVNTGGQRLRTFDLIIFTDLDVLQFQSVTPGVDFIPALTVDINQDSLSIIGMGMCGSICDTQQLIHIANLNFTAVNTSLVQIDGLIISLSSDTVGDPISEGQSFIAGQVEFLITEEGMRSRRMIFNGNSKKIHHIKRQTDCQTSSNCDCAIAGDLNRDCVLDASDVQFLLTYLAEETYDFQLTSFNLTASQISDLDVDKNGAVDMSDAYILERVSLNLLHLLTNVTITPIQLSMDCTLMVSASFLRRQSSANNNLSVFFDFSFPFDRTFTLQRQFDDSIFEQGRYITGGKSLAIQGGLVIGEYVSEATQYISRIRTNLTLTNITLNVIQVNRNAAQQSSLSPSRIQPMFGFPDPPFEYPQSIEFDLPVGSNMVSIPVSYGFNSFMTFDNLLSTAACMNRSGITPPPVFNSVNYTASVNENQEIGTHVVTVLATTETVYSIQYFITSGNDLGYFTINGITGNITTNVSLDAESSVTEFTLVITASLLDTEPTISSNVSVFITVFNVNEAPVISPIGNIEVNVTEPVNSTVVQLTVTDPDTSNASFSTLTITGILPATSVFAIIDDRVVVNEYLATGPALNYTIDLEVTDALNSSLSSTVSFTVMVVNIPQPTFEMQVYSVNASESTEIGTILTTFNIIAPPGSTIVYNVKNFTSQFGIDEEFNQLILLGNFNFEERSNYQFDIEAIVTISGENYTAEATIEIFVFSNISNITVEFTMDMYNASIQEGSDNGTFVLQVRATIGNSNSTVITYSLANDSVVPFVINSTTGEIVVDGLLDYESAVQSYSFFVMATEIEGRFDTALVFINITNINDNPPSILPHPSIVVLSDTPQNTIIATIQSNDVDRIEGLQYVLMDSPIANINSTTGEITSNNLTENSVGVVYTLTVVVTDGEFNDSTNLSVLLLDPVYNLTTTASPFINQSILTLSDRTVDDIMYFTTQLPDGLILNNTNGVLDQIGILASSSYQLIINVTSPTQTVPITVYIIVIRDNSAPVFSNRTYTVSLPVNAPIGMQVIQLSASDVDLDDQLVYSIESNYSFITNIDPLTGIVITTGCLPSAIQGSTITVAVYVTDGELNATALLNITIASAMGNTSCVEFNFTSEVDIEYSINGGGFLVNTDERLTRVAYSQSFSFLTEQSGTFTARVGNIQQSISYRPQRLMAESVTAVLLNDVVYHDDPVVKVALQVQDVRYSTNVLATTVRIQVTHPTNTNVGGSCIVNTPSGTCIVEASLPDEWFTTAANISVQYGIVGGADMMYLGSVQITPRVNYTVSYTVALTAPARPLYRGQQFVIPIVAHAGFAISSYQLLMAIPEGIMMNRITVDTSRWSVTQSSSASNSDGSVFVSLLATLLSDVVETITRDMETTPTSLAEVTLMVQSSAVENIEYHINCTVIQLVNIRENVLVNGAPPVAMWVTRHGIERQLGTVFVVSDSVMGLFAYSSQSELVYVDTGMQYDVRLITARALQGLTTTVPTSCESSNEAILNVSNDCRSVFLTATQAEPEYLVNISLSRDGHVVDLPFKIWFPVNHSLLVSDDVLNPINGWFNPDNNCAPVYQHTTVRVESIFTDGERLSEVVDITRYVTSSLQVLNSSIAVYQDGYLIGITPGVTMLVLQSNGALLASSNITVTSDPIDILSLDATPVVAVTLSSSASVELYDTHSVNVLIQDVLEFEGAEAYIAVTALLSDSTRFPLHRAPNVLINSLNTDVVVVSSRAPFLVEAGRNSGSGELLEVNITSQNCSRDSSVFSQPAFINVSLPTPVSVSVIPSSIQLAKVSDAAALVGIATSITIRVIIGFENGRSQEMTGDDRTIYNISSGLNITMDGNMATLRASPNATSGSQSVQVSFSHVSLSTSISVQIIQALDIELEAHPFPHYPGSNQYNTTILYPIANTGLWEQAIITASLILSDNARRDTSSSSHLTLSLNATPSQLAENISIIQNQVLNIDSATAVGFVDITGMFGNINSSNLLRINVSTVPVVVDSIDSVYLMSRRTYITGVRDIGSDQVIVSITLNDSTRYVDLFTRSARPLPQLLQFSTSNSGVLSVNESTGSLTLHNNSRMLQTITVTAQVSRISHSDLRVACNLAPDVGDVDLGSQSGLPLSPFMVGSTVNIPLYVNAGTTGVASLDIDVMYPTNILQAQNVTLSPLSSTNPFVSTTNDPSGVVGLGGTLDQVAARGTILIATLQFVVIGEADSVVEFTGTINTFHDIEGMLIGRGGRFVAGNVEADIVSSVNQRRRAIQYSTSPVVTSRRNRRATCDNPPCSSCPDGRDMGDTNFDCVLNVQDVTFTRIYITEAPLNFMGSLAYLLQNVSDEQRSAIDSDRNGVINIDDAFYLLRVVFGLLRFVGNHTIINGPPDCRLLVSFTLYSDGRRLTDGSDASKMILGVLVAHSNESFQQAFNSDDVIDGQRLPLSTSFGLIGGIVMADFTGNGIFTVTFGRNIAQYDNIGISLIQLTTDDLGMSNLARQIFLRGRPIPPYVYTGRLEVEVNNTDITLLASSGYNPLLSVISSEGCDVSTTVTPTPTSTTASITSATRSISTTAIVTSSIPSNNTTAIISSSVSPPSSTFSFETLTTTFVILTPSSPLVGTSSLVAPTSTVRIISSPSPIISNSSLLPTLSSTSTITPTSATTPTSAITPPPTITLSLTVTPTSTTTLSSAITPPSVIIQSSTVQVNSSIPTSSGTESFTSSVVVTTAAAATTMTTTVTPVVTPSMTTEFPSITPTISEGMNIKLLDQVMGNVSNGFTQDFGLLAVPSQTITASLAGYRSQVSIEENRRPASKFKASVLLHDNRVWADGNNVPVVFQVHDDDWSTRVELNTTIIMTVTLVNADSLMMYSCRPNENNGICMINAEIPLGWFDASSIQQASLTYNTPNSMLIATLGLQPHATITSSLDQVVVELPSRTLFLGETFTATVYAYSLFSINGFTLIFETSSNINILGISIDSSTWSYSEASINQQFSVAAFSNDPEGSPLDMNRTLLLTLNLQATQQLSIPNNFSFINGTVESLTTARGPVVLNNLNSTSGPIIMWTRNTQSTIGVLDIVEEHPLILFAVATTNQIVNTFVLSGINKTASISLLVGYSSGQLREVTNDLSCMSNNESVISIETRQCSRVTAGSREAAYANVTIAHMNLSVDVTFKIWFPQIPVQILLSDDTLNRVDNKNCIIYQKATITALANFVSGDSSVVNVITTDYVSSSITSSQPSVANVTGTVVVGIAPGETDICVERNGIKWGCTSVSVSTELVEVYDLTAVLVNRITISEDPVANRLLINVGYLLEIDGDRAGVAAAVRYTDGTIFVPDDVEILLESLNTTIFETDGANIISRNTGQTQMNITWLPFSCVTGLHSLFDISLSLQSPTGIRINLPTSPLPVSITPSSDAAQYVGIPTAHAIIVELLYSNRTQDITTDNRTTYTIMTGDDALVVNQNDNGVSVMVNNNTNVTFAVLLRISYLSLTPQFVTFEIVRAKRLDLVAHHYPPYNGSYTDAITVLRLISGTGIRQQAALRLILQLTNSREIIVTTNDMTTFRLNSSTPSGLLNNTAISQVNGDVVLSVLSSEVGNITVEGMFTTSIATETKTIELIPFQTFVTNLIVNPLPSATLRGQYSTMSASLTVNIQFDDGSRISNLLPSDLPGLLNFTSLNSTAFAVTELGMLSPLANTHTPVTVVVNTITESLSIPYQFFVNLDPSIGDIDLGSPNGAPVVVTSATVLQVPVFVNTGEVDLGAIEVNVQFDPTILQATNVSEGTDWQQGISDYNIDNVAGSVDFGGAVMAAGVRGTRVHVFTLNFVVTRPVSSSIVTNLITTIQTITELSIESATIGNNTPRLSTAGNVSFTVGPLDNKRSTGNRLTTISRIVSQRVVKKQIAPCTGDGCVTATMPGDANGDGVFDIRDVAYTLLYIVEASLDFNSARGMLINSSVTASQLTSLDADLNTVIDIADAIFLLKAVFRLAYLIQDPVINPGNPSTNCLVEISANLTTGTSVPVDDVVVYFDIGLFDIEAHNNFTESTLLDGAVITYDKGDGQFGGIIMARRRSTGQFVATINSSLVNSAVGISILQVTFDSLNTSRLSRTAQLFGAMTFPLVYPYPLDFTIDIRGYNFTVFASHGYNPLISSDIGTTICTTIAPSAAPISTTTEFTLSTMEYAVIAVSLVLFVLAILFLLIAIRHTCQARREKHDSAVMDDFTQEEDYVVRNSDHLI